MTNTSLISDSIIMTEIIVNRYWNDAHRVDLFIVPITDAFDVH